MASNNYISLEIDGVKADIDPKGQIPTVSYQLEDEKDFEQKKAAESFNVELPGTLINDQIHNTLHNPSVVDNTAAQSYDNFKSARYIANGDEILIGKYLQQSVVKRNGRVEKYKGKLYGLNGDWVIDLKEKTLFDFVNPRSHTFDANTIIASWNFDGRNEATDYLYAPVRYRKPFGEYPTPTVDDPEPHPLDDNVLINDMKPSISIYWLLWRGLKSLGYRLVSEFMDTDYYRKSLLPWTWGGFDYMDDTRWDPLKFLASQAASQRFEGDHTDEFPNLDIKADGTIPGTFDNNGLFSYTNGASTIPYMMMWQYPTSPANLNLGKIRVNFSVELSWAFKIQNNSDASLYEFWYKNGAQVEMQEVFSNSAPAVGTREGAGFDEMVFETDMLPGDWVGTRPRIHLFESGSGFARQDLKVESFKINFIKFTDGSTIDLKKQLPKVQKLQMAGPASWRG